MRSNNTTPPNHVSLARHHKKWAEGAVSHSKQGGGKTFVTKGFKLWNQIEKLSSHVGGVNSAHNQVVKKSEDLMKEKQHIHSVLVKQSNQDKIEYQIQLNVIVDCIRFLLC